MTKAKRKAPSRVKYEQAHPTVSCRVPTEVYDQLQVAKEAEGMSFADILKVGLGILEVRAREEAEVRERGRETGYREGYAEAERLYKVTYPCSVCDEMLEVTTEDQKKAIKKYMPEHGWGHSECVED